MFGAVAIRQHRKMHRKRICLANTEAERVACQRNEHGPWPPNSGGLGDLRSTLDVLDPLVTWLESELYSWSTVCTQPCQSQKHGELMRDG